MSIQEHLVSFESGHYKKVMGEWQGDSVWCHIKKADGTMVHINKDKVEYIQVSQIKPKLPVAKYPGGSCDQVEAKRDVE